MEIPSKPDALIPHYFTQAKLISYTNSLIKDKIGLNKDHLVGLLDKRQYSLLLVMSFFFFDTLGFYQFSNCNQKLPLLDSGFVVRG